MSFGATAASKVLDVEVCCFRVFTSRVIPKGSNPVAIANQCIDLNVMPNRGPKLSG